MGDYNIVKPITLTSGMFCTPKDGSHIVKKFLWCTTFATIATVVTFLFTEPVTYADATAPQPTIKLPEQAVLNQTWFDGVPMVSNALKAPDIVSQAAVVMDMNTGTVVYAKNPNVTHYPASITKIMTAMLALQDGKLNDEITVSKEAANQPPDKLYFVPGEQKTLEQMLYGLLLISANDAAVAIADEYGGNVSNFADMMNQEAKSLGATHTHFDNPNGLPDPNHTTTAYDMALITRAAMQNPEFRKIVATRSYKWQGQAWKSQLSNINSMLFTYPGAIGIKTGWTSVAHETLAVAATRDNQTFLAILMDAPTNYAIHNDAKQLLDFAFAHYKTEVFASAGDVVGAVPVTGGKTVPMKLQEDVVATVRTDQQISPASSLDLIKNQNDGSNPEAHVADMMYRVEGEPSVLVPVIANLPSLKTDGKTSISGWSALTALHFIKAYWREELAGLVIVATACVLAFIRRRKQRVTYPQALQKNSTLL